MVESIIALKIGHPSVYMRMPEDAPDEYLQMAATDLAQGNNRAQVISDSAVVRAQMERGVPEADARMYVCGGCMEIAPQGMNGDLLFTMFFNTPMVLELVLNGGLSMVGGRRMLPRYDRELSDFGSFEELYETFAAQLRETLFLSFKKMDIWSEEMARHRPAYLLSSQTECCIERGLPVNGGGAKYEDFAIRRWAFRISPTA